jgi:hypothetical protein
VSRSCESCASDNRRELDRRIRSGATLPDLARWLDSLGEKRSINALSRHRQQHVLPERVPSGPRPRGTSFLEAVETSAWDDMTAGVLRPSIRDGIGARAELNKQSSRSADRDLMARIALALTGTLPVQARVIDPETEALEASYRLLLTDGESLPKSGTERRAELQGR